MNDRCYPHRNRCCKRCPEVVIAPEVIAVNGPFTVISSLPVHEPTCVFPDCRYDARIDFETCELHQRVTVTGSWVESAKHEDDGGN